MNRQALESMRHGMAGVARQLIRARLSHQPNFLSDDERESWTRRNSNLGPCLNLGTGRMKNSLTLLEESLRHYGITEGTLIDGGAGSDPFDYDEAEQSEGSDTYVLIKTLDLYARFTNAERINDAIVLLSGNGENLDELNWDDVASWDLLVLLRDQLDLLPEGSIDDYEDWLSTEVDCEGFRRALRIDTIWVYTDLRNPLAYIKEKDGSTTRKSKPVPFPRDPQFIVLSLVLTYINRQIPVEVMSSSHESWGNNDGDPSRSKDNRNGDFSKTRKALRKIGLECESYFVNICATVGTEWEPTEALLTEGSSRE